MKRTHPLKLRGNKFKQFKFWEKTKKKVVPGTLLVIFLHNDLVNFRLAQWLNCVACNMPVFSWSLLVHNFFFCDSWHQSYPLFFCLIWLLSSFNSAMASPHHFVPFPSSSFNHSIDTDAAFAADTDLTACSFSCICLKHFEFCLVPREPVAVQV